MNREMEWVKRARAGVQRLVAGSAMGREALFDDGTGPGASSAWQYRLLAGLMERGDVVRCGPDGGPIHPKSPQARYRATERNHLRELLSDEEQLTRLIWPPTARPPQSLGTLGDLMRPPAPEPEPAAPSPAPHPSVITSADPNPVPPSETPNLEVAAALQEVQEGMLTLARAIQGLTRELQSARLEIQQLSEMWR